VTPGKKKTSGGIFMNCANLEGSAKAMASRRKKPRGGGQNFTQQRGWVRGRGNAHASGDPTFSMRQKEGFGRSKERKRHAKKGIILRRGGESRYGGTTKGNWDIRSW